MRIGLSLLALRPGKVGGVETYVRRMLEEWPALAGGDRLVAFLDRDLARALETPGFERVVVDRSARRLVADRILEAFTPFRAAAVERAVTAAGADVILFPQQSIFPRGAGGRAVVTVVDVQHLFFPGNFGLFDRAFRALAYPRAMAGADRLLAISEFTRRTLVERAGVPPSRVIAVPFGHASKARAPVEPTELVRRPYLFYPAATFAHKGHARLLRAYAELRRRRALDARLVFTGMQTGRWRSLERLARKLGIREDVVHLGHVPYAEVRRVYAGAEAVVFPTEFEGYGIPVLEAVEHGKRIVTSRLEVFDEIGVPGECQIDFDDPDQLLAALQRPGPVELTRPVGTWAGCAARTLEILRGVVDDSRAGSRAP